MVTKADFTADEWKQIQRAPFLAGLAVVAASPSGPFGEVKEMFAVGKKLAEVKTQGSSNELVKGLVADPETGAREQGAPAVYETVKEKVVDRPAYTVWKKGTGPIQKVDYATGEIMWRGPWSGGGLRKGRARRLRGLDSDVGGVSGRAAGL
jgi:hypothetical protein